jgi:predicted alpha/beta superfamily hydrolase
MRFATVLIALAAGAIALAAQAASPQIASTLTVVSTGPAVKMATEQLILHSAALNRDVVIEVTKPFAPPTTPGQKFPAVYALDGGYDFAGQEGWLLGGAGRIAGAYMVTVGDKPADYGKRETDLTSLPVTRKGHTQPGGSDSYRRFLLEELKPFIEARYPVDPGRAVLVGHSLGGSFALALLADRPGAFSGYVVGSPGIWNEPNLPGRVAAAKGGGARIFIAAGGRETARIVDSFAQLTAALGRNTSLKVRSQIFPDSTHVGYYPELIAQGLAFVLPPSGS